jgi:nucleosome binding factor SPN SPT16 subunit
MNSNSNYQELNNLIRARNSAIKNLENLSKSSSQNENKHFSAFMKVHRAHVALVRALVKNSKRAISFPMYARGVNFHVNTGASSNNHQKAALVRVRANAIKRNNAARVLQKFWRKKRLGVNLGRLRLN